MYTVESHEIEKETDSILNGKFVRTPLVAPVNIGTARSSEILAGALKDNTQETLVEEKKISKAVVKTVSQLNRGIGVTVRVNRYETPAHHYINRIRIAPHVQSLFIVADDVSSCFPRNVL